MEKSAKFKTHYPLFMKPIVPTFLTSFSIPVSFKEKLEKEGYYETEKVVLVNEFESQNRDYDDEWEVKVEDGRHFKEGWKEFCDDHKLNVGDFLVFEHLGNLVFHVSVYDPATACERQFHKGMVKRDTLNHNYSHRRKPLEALETATTQASKSKSSFVVTLTPTLMRAGLNFPMAFVRSNRAFFERCCDMKLIYGSGQSLQVKLKYRRGNSQSYICGGWKDFLARNNLKIGNVICFKVKNCGKMPALKCYIKDGRLTCNNSATRRTRPVKVKAATTEVVQQSVESQSSHCDVTLTPYLSKRGDIYLSMLFVRSNGLFRRHCQVELIDEKGSSWQVTLNYRKRCGQPYIAQGWKKFQVAKNLKTGDVIRFQVLKAVKDYGKMLMMKCYRLTS